MSDPITDNAMDHAAAKATNDLATLDANAVKVVAQWWKDHYLKAGHKRLARSLLATLKKEN
jgi:hypothetical protein